jgi:hypothetical protein
MTAGEMYEPAMKIKTKREATAYFTKLIAIHLEAKPTDSIERAVEVQKSNLGYFAGYYDAATRDRVYKLFKAAHPIFGTAHPTPEEAFEMGKKWADKSKRKKKGV